jgi:hypothetical protein
MLDIYLDELEKLDEEHEADLPAEKTLAPIMVLQKESPTKSIRKEAQVVLNDKRVRGWLGLADGGADSEAEQKGRREDHGDDADGGWDGFED